MSGDLWTAAELWLGVLLGGTVAYDSRPQTLVWGEIGGTSCCFLDLHVLLRLDEDVPHLGDIVLHQMLVK